MIDDSRGPDGGMVDLTRRVDGRPHLFGTDGRDVYLSDGQAVKLVVASADGRVAVLTDYDHWYVAALRPVPGTTVIRADVLKVHGGKPYAYHDADKLAARLGVRPA